MEETRKLPVTREAALRIALAARAVPKASLPALSMRSTSQSEPSMSMNMSTPVA